MMIQDVPVTYQQQPIRLHDVIIKKGSLKNVPVFVSFFQMMLILGGIAVVILIIIIGKLESSVYCYENCSLPGALSCKTDQLLRYIYSVGDIK
jgi:hypothetical protein